MQCEDGTGKMTNPLSEEEEKGKSLRAKCERNGTIVMFLVSLQLSEVYVFLMTSVTLCVQ
jgi:hypothetical protein